MVANAASTREVSASELAELVAEHKGKPLLLVYWASWCVPCRQYKEKLAALRGTYPEADLEMLGVSVDTDKDMLNRFLTANTMPFKTVVASEKFYEEIAGTPSRPQFFMARMELSNAGLKATWMKDA